MDMAEFNEFIRDARQRVYVNDESISGISDSDLSKKIVDEELVRLLKEDIWQECLLLDGGFKSMKLPGANNNGVPIPNLNTRNRDRIQKILLFPFGYFHP